MKDRILRLLRKRPNLASEVYSVYSSDNNKWTTTQIADLDPIIKDMTVSFDEVIVKIKFLNYLSLSF